MEEYISKSLSLLSLEREAELSRGEAIISSQLQDSKLLESRGICLLRLKVSGQNVGLYGKQVVSFQCAVTTKSFPSTTISSGDIVGVFSNGKSVAEKVVSGIVTVMKQSSVSVAFDELPDTVDLTSFNGSLQLVKLCNDVTYQRMKRCLESMKSSIVSHHLVPVLFGSSPLSELNPQFSSYLTELSDEAVSHSSFPFVNASLNLSQQRAVLFALSRRDVAIIHGPPGTGKTTTVIEIILQSIKQGSKILACAPSNLAVDNLVEKLGVSKAKVVRIGHPARIVDAVQKYSLDALLSAADSADIIKDVRKDLQTALEHSLKSRTSSERRRWRNDVRSFKQELLKREEKAVKEILGNAQVVLSTINGASPDGTLRYLPENYFDVVVIDECAQAVEPSCWIGVLRAHKCILAGDDKQLPPTILSNEASKGGLSITMMERLHMLYGKVITSTLVTQYRMHKNIMSWPSEFLYDSLLEADSSVADHLLSDLPGVMVTPLTNVPLIFIDTAGCNMTELDTPEEESKGNEGEADLVLHYLKKLVMASVPLNCIAVITPYNLQVELIRQRLSNLGKEYESIEVHTVDGFQGREKEAVIISFTRSNEKGEYGFLHEMRRTNVAMTRARRHLALIGDSSTVSREPFINGMISYCQEHGEVCSAHDYINDYDFEEAIYYKPKMATKVDVRPEKPVAKKKQLSSTQGKPSLSRVHVGSVSEVTPKQHISDGSTVSNVTELMEECFQKYREKLKSFVESDQVILKLPSSLTSSERKCIHQICEEMGLMHVSKGQRNERYLEVAKVSVEAKVRQSTEKESECHQDNLQFLVSDVTCPTCGKSVPEGNIKLHSMHCSKEKVSVTRSAGMHGSAMKSTRVRKKKQQTNIETESEDLDAMLAEMSLIDSSCSLHGCKKKVNLLGLQCYFCSRRFCMEHNVPEVHGCAEAAKKHARQALKAKPTSSSSCTKRTQLQKRLESRLEDLSSGRRSKTKRKA